MTFKITGSVRKTLEKNAGKTRSGGDFVSREVVVTVPNGDYMDDICLRAFGEQAVDKVSDLQTGDEVTVEFNIRSREWNGRWFTDLNIVDVKKDAAPEADAPFGSDDDLPI